MKRALLSVSDKTGLVDFAKALVALDYELISTGGTLRILSDAGVPAINIEAVTHFPEMLDGRVKTLHPAVHGGLLAKRDNPEHMQMLAEQGIQPIDLVCVNLYPFKETIQKPEVTQAQAIENIDIGGPSMLRSAAKNFAAVVPVVDPQDYEAVITALREDSLSAAFRQQLAAKVFRHTAAYDALIAAYFTTDPEPETLTLTYNKQQSMRYGENSHQKAAFYADPMAPAYSMVHAKQLHGKALSYNNLRDANAALQIIAEFTERPAVVALKHMNPCGIGEADNLESAWDKAYESDPISIFGGIIALNREVDAQTAAKMHELFLEIIIAPSYTDEAFAILAKKKNLRLLTVDFSQPKAAADREITGIMGGILVQEGDQTHETIDQFTVVSKKQPTEAQMKALQFGQTVVKHVKSNAIVVTTADQTLGVGAGQQNRIDSVKIAIEKAQTKPAFKDAILASDAFFPMDDSVAYAAAHGITAIVEPGGSIKDKDSIKKADELGVALVFTGVRHFKH
ncbi:bifunctional phosphoribosylaminoimidazolecarboxamide formyltransferase/IMP cyclohydrolase [Agrilactobacillus fermenti]|uniref:bifunctional phosphoribosylaminoimidazolecarboxamide formyltransferase/IMP cyclohydrolase n=1 Tax=Agrilactobacillus fermenti TaxID=2586909 RepID=UPI001E47859B|nr:bifunctional phosphoribosylaminoimidazolecarboxamide formyltransferase/IMP cyclohydrolase [Agrilactobacillus fermenti]MCD2255897.1 bifunctional phosphoribosylaminoimidazolecarboxamide formyltransferase/IMP cyclohydrolase [Agrilactobacillus fermenti]